LLQLHKEEIKQLLRAGERLKAVKFARETFNISLHDAVRLVNTVDQELNPEKKIDSNTFVQRGKVPFLATLVLVILGIIFMGVAIAMFYFDQKAINTFTKTTGEVIALANTSDGEGASYAPVVAFQWEGRELTFQSSTSSNPPGFQVGEEVELYVNPVNPYDVLINSFGQRFTGMLIFGFMGIVFLGIPGVIRLFFLKKF
jgi:hypothetical protein